LHALALAERNEKPKKCEILLDHIFAIKKKVFCSKILYGIHVRHTLLRKVIFLFFKLYAYHHFRKLNSANVQCFLC